MDNLVIVWTLGTACNPDRSRHPLLISIYREGEERKVSTPYDLREEELNKVITGCASNEALQQVRLYMQQEEMSIRYVASLLDTCTTTLYNNSKNYNASALYTRMYSLRTPGCI